MTQPLRPCRRCLMAEVPGEEALAEIIRQRIEQMPEEIRASDGEMSHRLEICKKCDHLMNGTCVLCGCYAELRAARAHMKCPDVPARWQAEVKENTE